jgi:hypothetical protein
VWFLKKEYLLIFYLATTFFNIMNIKDIPFFGSLITTYLAATIIIFRFFKFRKKIETPIFLCILGIGLIIVNFLFLSLQEFYIKTAIKSSLQLVYLIIFILVMTIVRREDLYLNLRVIAKEFHKFLLVYLFFSFLFSFDNRLDGFSGAQCLAFQLAIINLYYFNSKIPKFYKWMFFIFLVLTGSRTYVFLTVGIIIIKQLKKVSNKYKIILFSSIPIIFVIL